MVAALNACYALHGGSKEWSGCLTMEERLLVWRGCRRFGHGWASQCSVFVV